MRYLVRFIDVAVFDPKRMTCTREQLMARVLLDLSISVLLKVMWEVIS